MYQFSDSESQDSDEGIRFKTDSTRNKRNRSVSRSRSQSRTHRRSRSCERSGRSSRRNSADRDHRSRHKTKRDDDSKRKSKDRTQKRDDRSRSNNCEKRDKTSSSLSTKVRRKEVRSSESSPSALSKEIKEDRAQRHISPNVSSSTFEVKKSVKLKANVEKLNENKETVSKQGNKEKVVEIIGPALPPHLIKTQLNKAEAENVLDRIKNDDLDPGISKTTRNKDVDNKAVTSAEKVLEVIGPVLPPRLLRKQIVATEIEQDTIKPKEHNNETTISLENEEKVQEVIGPVLPPHLAKKRIKETEFQETPNQDGQEDYIGPQLPVANVVKTNIEETKSETPQCIGPTLPPHLRKKLEETASITPESNETSDNEEEEEIYGPLPAGQSTYSKSHLALEERALQLKLDQLDPREDKPKTREEWMLELPEVKAANLGLGPRQFRSKPGPDMSDRSSWTDTPEKKKKAKEVEVDLKKEAELKAIRKRDKEQEDMAKKHKKKKNQQEESLLELHQNKIKKNKKVKKKKTREICSLFCFRTKDQVNVDLLVEMLIFRSIGLMRLRRKLF